MNSRKDKPTEADFAVWVMNKEDGIPMRKIAEMLGTTLGRVSYSVGIVQALMDRKDNDATTIS